MPRPTQGWSRPEGYTPEQVLWARMHDNGNRKPYQSPLSEAALILLMDRDFRKRNVVSLHAEGR